MIPFRNSDFLHGAAGIAEYMFGSSDDNNIRKVRRLSESDPAFPAWSTKPGCKIMARKSEIDAWRKVEA